MMNRVHDVQTAISEVWWALAGSKSDRYDAMRRISQALPDHPAGQSALDGLAEAEHQETHNTESRTARLYTIMDLLDEEQGRIARAQGAI